MIAVVGGLGAALLFAAATLSASRGSRIVGPYAFAAGVTLVGAAIVGPIAAAAGAPANLDARSLGWLAVTGVGNVAGLILSYAALRSAKVGLVAPIISADGAVAAAISVLSGEHLAAAPAATLAVIAGGVMLAGMAPDEDGAPKGGPTRTAIGYAVCAAGVFGASLYAAGHVSGELPIAWVVLPPRVVGVLAVALPLWLSSRLRLPRRAVPFVVCSGVCEVVGFALFAVAARRSIAISAVLASQFAALAAVAAFVLFRERLGRVQLAGVAAVVIGVGVLSVLRA